MTESNDLPDRDPALRVTPLPADVNIHGDVFGGWIMSQADIAGAIVAERTAQGRVVTVAVNEFVFKHRVAIGDLVSFYGEAVRVGTTSIAVEVEVYAQRRPEDVETYKVTEALITYVAVDQNGEKRRIPAG
jgi:acyl-CoA thioesterase YciA